MFEAADWKALIDIDHYVFPAHIAITTLRLDIVLFSNSTKEVILIELTCSCKQNMEERHQDKTTRYFHLCNQIKSNGWSVQHFPVEVGARGYCSKNVPRLLQTPGFRNKQANSLTKQLGSTSMETSFVIFL